jgi:hypothetical protein
MRRIQSWHSLSDSAIYRQLTGYEGDAADLEPLVWQGNAAAQRCSDEPDIMFHRLDHRVHLSVPHLFGKAKGEAFGRVEGNMRRQ